MPKRRRTERRRPLPTSDYGLTGDEKECILALLALSRAPVIHDEEMTPAEEESSSLLRPEEEEEQSKSLPLPSSSPPKLSLWQQEQTLSLPPPAERDLSPLILFRRNSTKRFRYLPRRIEPYLLFRCNRTGRFRLRQSKRCLRFCARCQYDDIELLCLRRNLRSNGRLLLYLWRRRSMQNQSRYRCLEWSKAFSSYQALGGHKTCHRKRPAENSAAASVVAGATDQNKLHTCSLCPKSFPTGQALGGHMRAHYEGNKIRATAESRPVAATPSSSLTECATAKGLGIDLNLPAPEAASCQPATSQPPRL